VQPVKRTRAEQSTERTLNGASPRARADAPVTQPAAALL
jgi:hypothetical protein